MSTYIQNSHYKMWFTKLVNFAREVFMPSVVVNAFIYYDGNKVLRRNWGDDINYFFLKKLWHKAIVCYDMSSLSHRLKRDNYMIIGSSLTLLCNKQSIVWGAGVIDNTKELPAYPKKVLAVRGPLTRQYLLCRGIECPAVYGDPALLMPKVYYPSIYKRYKLGIIPHYSDYDSPLLDRLKQDSNILFIQMEGYQKWTDVVDMILSCETIASSSLHGLIMSEAYHIPNCWIEITGNLLGGHFKFHDFFLSIGQDRSIPFQITPDTTQEDIFAAIKSWLPGNIDLEPLIKQSPFKCHFHQ